MFKKRFFLAIALAGITIASALSTNLLSNLEFISSAAVECTGGGSESFSNIPASNSAYATRTWTGDNGVAWSATDARTDQTLTGRAIAVRTGIIKNTTAVAGGVGTLSFKYKRVFTGNSTLKVYVNGVQYGGDITVSSETAATFTYAVNVSGNATIELRNTQNRIVVDDLSWTCFATVAGPEIQIADVAGTNFDCGALEINYGSHAAGVYNDAVFTVKNVGTAPLTVLSVSLSNSDDFTVISPVGAFTVPASGSAIVLVRFDATSGGEKTSILTLTSNDANEQACTINLKGIGLEPCVAPEAAEGLAVVDSITASSAGFEVTGVDADNYLVVLSENDSLTAGPVSEGVYIIGDTIGGGVVAYNGSNAEFTLTGLEESTTYHAFVFAYNSVNCSEGPQYADGFSATFTTPVAPCVGGSETFANMPASSSAYATRTWTGDNGMGWTATDARTDQTLDGRAIALRTGTLENTTPATGGIGTLTFTYKRVFTGNSTLKVFVNGVQYGDDITVSADTPSTFSQAIDLAGAVSVEIQNSGNRVIIDNLSWTCYTVPNTPELQLLDTDNTPKACGGFTLDFGAVKTGTDKQATFKIKNQGTEVLEINALTLSDSLNYTIVSPETASFTIDSLGVQEVVIKFNSTDADEYIATLTIESNDADEETCVVNLTASAQDVCIAPEDSEGIIIPSNITVEGADIEITDITATGYVVVVSEGGTVTSPVDGTTYEAGESLGAGTVVYSGTSNEFTIEGLNANTGYTIYVFAYNNSGCVDGPAYSAGVQDEFSTLEGPCGGSETFTNMPANASSYATRNWTGDNGIAWTATDARTDQTMTGRAICVRVGKVENTTVITGGIGTLTFSYARVFTNNSVIKVFVNNVQYGADVIVSSETPGVYSQVINVAGDATITIQNSGYRSIIDNIEWTCYSDVQRPSQALNLQAEEEGVKLYPNPSEGQFNIALPEGNERAQVEVFNAMGKLVFSKEINASEPVNVSSAGKGTYMVNITANGKRTSRQVVIK